MKQNVHTPKRAEDRPGEPGRPRPGLLAGRPGPTGVQDAALPPEYAKSRYGKWRALSLILVYVAMILHITHWKVSGKTMAPLELSEIMKALELGVLSPGVIFIGVMLLGSAIFGRFFCSWGCHMLALQDLFHWIFKRLRIRPHAIRSRVLLLVPFLTAGYMFFWPQIKRLAEGRELPEASARLVTTSFWRDLPGPLVITLTVLTCGLLIVFLFGGRGFCTYGCPYGVLFGLMDRIAPGKIRARSGCEQCGRCTAVCTSGVRVHEEVNAYGMVVNPRCLKDLDCVGVCPNNALEYKFGRPSLARSRSGLKPPPPRYDFSFLEEIAMILVFALALFTWRNLYYSLPFLMSIALSAATAYIAITFVRLLSRPQLNLNRYPLKADGKLSRPGTVFAVTAAIFLIFAAHSGFVQYHRWRGERYLAVADAASDLNPESKQERRAALERSVAHFQTCERWGLFSSTNLEFALGSIMLDIDRIPDAENYLKRAVARSPNYAAARIKLAKALAKSGHVRQADNHLTYALDITAPHEEHQPLYRHLYAEAHVDKARLLVGQAERQGDPRLRQQQIQLAERHYHSALELDDNRVDAHIGLGYLASLGGVTGLQQAVGHYEKAIRLHPRSAWAHANLGDVFAELGRARGDTADYRRAIEQYGQAVELDPEMDKTRFRMCVLRFQLDALPDAVAYFAEVVRRSPNDAEARHYYGRALQRAGRHEEAREQLARATALLNRG